MEKLEQIQGYDNWKTTPPEERAEKCCTSCGSEIYEGDYLYTIDGETLCEDCLNNAYREMA